MIFSTVLLCIVICSVGCSSLAVPEPYSCGTGSHFTAPNGTIKSHIGLDLGHNYGKNVHCVWTIQAPVGQHVEIVPDSFDVEQTTNCDDDYLEIFDGNGTNADASLGKYCGTSLATFSSSGNVMTLLFVSDDSKQNAGFKLFYYFTATQVFACASNLYQCTNKRCVDQSYRCDGDDDCMDDSDEHNCPPYTCSGGDFPCQKDKKCIQKSWLCDGDSDCSDGADEKPYNCNGGPGYAALTCGTLNYTSSSGDIQTPGYPSNTYPDSLNCKWEIFAPSGTQSIQFTFEANFNIENDVQCAYDYLQIYSDGNTFKHGPYCGTRAPAQFSIPARHAIVEFTSDNSDGYAGFKLHFTTH